MPLYLFHFFFLFVFISIYLFFSIPPQFQLFFMPVPPSGLCCLSPTFILQAFSYKVVARNADNSDEEDEEEEGGEEEEETTPPETETVTVTKTKGEPEEEPKHVSRFKAARMKKATEEATS